MIPIDSGKAGLVYWAAADPEPTVFGGREEGARVIPCPALVTFPEGRNRPPVVRVAYKMDEIEVARLARGGTLWLSTWGGLPIHVVEVQEP